MTHQLVTKTVAGLLIPCVILSAISCYSYQAVDLKDAEVGDDLIVGTKGGHFFRLVSWTADSLGNINGRGGECGSLGDAQNSRYIGAYNGTIPSDSTAVIMANRGQQEETIDTMALVLIGGLLVVSVVVGIVALTRVEIM